MATIGEFGLTLYVQSLRNEVRDVGNTILRPGQSTFVHFSLLEDLIVALKLQQQNKIRVVGSIPPEILELVEEYLHSPVTTPSLPTPPADSRVYRDEFNTLQKAVNSKLDNVVDQAVFNLYKQGITKDLSYLTKNTRSWVDVTATDLVKGYDPLFDDSLGIQSVINQAEAAGKKKVIIPDGTFHIGHTIMVPRRMQVEMGKDTSLVPIKDVNMVQLKPESHLKGGVIDTRRFANRPFLDFTKACVYLDGNDLFSLYNELHRMEDLLLVGEDHYYTDQAWTGTGIHFYSGKGAKDIAKFISFVQANNIGIFNFNRGLYFDVDETIKNQSEWAWITGCTFDTIAMMNCKRSIELKGEGSVPRDVGGNQFKNLQIQIEPTSDFAIYCEGSYNTFEGLFWDLHKNPNPSIRFAKGSKFNRVICAHGYEQPQHFVDEGYMNQINSLTNHVPDVRTLAHHLSTPFQPNFLGNQDDYLVRGELRGYTIKQTSSHKLKNTYIPLTELLTMEMESGVTWEAAGATYENPIVLEVDTASDPIWYCNFMGLTSAWNTSPKGVRIEAYDDITKQWIFIHEVDRNTSFPFVVSAPWAGVSKATKIRYSFWGTNDPKGSLIQISRLFAMSSKHPGKAWFPKSGGDIDGKVYTKGGLVLEKRQSDPADAEEGQVWYRTDSTVAPARIMTAAGVRALRLETIPNEYLLISNAVKNGNTATIQESTTDFFRVTSSNNSDGLIIPIKPLALNKTYALTLDVELLNTVDDVLQIRLYNRTKAAYITTNLAVSAVTKNVKQNIKKNFVLDAATFTAGDAVELWIVQSWKNNTHDTFEFKVYKDTLAIN